VLPRTPLNAAIAVLLAAVAISVVAGVDLQNSLGKISGLVLGVLLFWAVCHWTDRADRLHAVLALFQTAGGALAMLALIGTNWRYKFPALGRVVAWLPTLRGLPGAEDGFNPNAVAGLLVLFLPLQLLLLIGANRRFGHEPRHAPGGSPWRICQVAFASLTAAVVLLSQCRGAWLGLALAALALIARLPSRPRLAAAAAVVVLGGAAIVSAPHAVFDSLLNQPLTVVSGGVGNREELWATALDAIQEVPYTGMGMNMFRKVVPLLYPLSSVSPDIDVAHAHNHFLQVALDLGLPGLVAYASLWIIAGVLLATTSRHALDPKHRLVAEGLGAGLVAHFVFSTTDTVALGSKAGILFWFALAAVTVLHRLACRAGDLAYGQSQFDRTP
jgi:putative inorganic carbon (HCO3(-)) transporter